jgi:ABC-2 type transport system ATP-binding protein
VIRARGLRKVFDVPVKDGGFAATLRHFFKREYKHIEAVRGLDLDIAAGEVVGFLGPNGAGKTTTLKMLTGLVHPTAGELEVGGHTPFERRRAFLESITLVMGQKQQLLWDLPAMDSLKINAAIYGIDGPLLARRIAELSEMLGLDEQLRQPVRKLSLGERMKAELLAALLHQPQVLFLDEPTLGLDVNAQSAVRRFLADYNARTGATILLTSHYMADITALCERVLLIHEGQMVYDGRLDELLERVAPYRELRLRFSSPQDSETLARYGEIEAVEGAAARLIVRRERLTESLTRALSELPVEDLTVSDPPVEEIIGRVFRKGGVE